MEARPLSENLIFYCKDIARLAGEVFFRYTDFRIFIMLGRATTTLIHIASNIKGYRFYLQVHYDIHNNSADIDRYSGFQDEYELANGFAQCLRRMILSSGEAQKIYPYRILSEHEKIAIQRLALQHNRTDQIRQR